MFLKKFFGTLSFLFAVTAPLGIFWLANFCDGTPTICAENRKGVGLFSVCVFLLFFMGAVGGWFPDSKRKPSSLLVLIPLFVLMGLIEVYILLFLELM
jgi:hypothetical protein